MMKHKAAKAAIGGLLAIGGAVGFSQAAFADGYQSISALESPGSYGHLSATLDWLQDGDIVTIEGGLHDTANDGHGPYLHVWAADTSSVQSQTPGCAIHNTSGPNTTKSVSCTVLYQNIRNVSIWVCNGGNVYGADAVEGGCYGRKYYNQVLYPGKGSVSLGTSYTPHGSVG